MNRILVLTLTACFSFVSPSDDLLKECFPGKANEDISVTLLNGGLSGSFLYKIDVDQKSYVLRIQRPDLFDDQAEREFIAFTEASLKGIAPKISYVSPDHLSILMEFIPHRTLSIDEAHIPNNCIRIAKALRLAHSDTSHHLPGESIQSRANRCSQKMLEAQMGSPQMIHKAKQLVDQYAETLERLPLRKVGIHGDLNPRNIILTDDNVYFIDWAETNRDDPFYDLTYFALKLDYSPEEEFIFLSSYLERIPTESEMKRYALNKKLHQAFWCLTNLYLADYQLKKNPEQTIDKKSPLKSWRYYQTMYAEGNQELPAQYFYDLSQLNFQLASE